MDRVDYDAEFRRTLGTLQQLYSARTDEVRSESEHWKQLHQRQKQDVGAHCVCSDGPQRQQR